MQEPPKGIVTDAKVVNVVDGDTIDLKIEKTIRVRLKDCWCAETRTGDLEEKEKGLAAKHHIEDLLGKRVLYYGRKKFNKDVVLFIPADEDGEIKDVFTFNRVLGYVFVVGEDVSERMVMDGHATKKKYGRER